MLVYFALFIVGFAFTCFGASLNINNEGGIQTTTKSLATNLMQYAIPGTGGLPAPYYWWEAGGMWGGMLDYWHYTGDASFNDQIANALVANVGPGYNFLGPFTDGNDDQGWWALSAMSASEYGLPVPVGGIPWVSVVQNVHGEMVSRWDMSSCAGGLKWKISPSADGYHYKSSIGNAIFFQLSARLYRATGNQMYADWAEKIFKWVRTVGLIDKDSWAVYDGTDDTINCRNVDHDVWSYNSGVFLYGSAIMQSLSPPSSIWAYRTNGLVGAVGRFFTPDGKMQEVRCEPTDSCDVDQLSFKAYLSRYMAATAAVLPALQPKLMPLLQSSAVGAVASCGNGPGSQTCGFKWTTNAFDGTQGVGQQLAALEVVHGLLATSPAKARREVTRRFGR